MKLRKILHVEDDDIRTVTVMALKLLGDVEVEARSSGGAALERAEALAPDPLLDVMTPRMDGPVTLAGLRAKPSLASAPVVFFTAKAQPEEVARLRSLGASEVLAKPVKPQASPGVLQRIWAAARG